MCLNFALMAVGLVFCLLLFACVFGFWSAGWFLDWMLLLCGGGWAGRVGLGAVILSGFRLLDLGICWGMFLGVWEVLCFCPF